MEDEINIREASNLEKVSEGWELWSACKFP
jgi:hypothetical protein